MGAEVRPMKSRALLTLLGVALVSLLLVDTGTEPAYAGAGASAYGAGDESQKWSSGATAVEAPATSSDLERGIAHIRQMDPGFDPAAFALWAQRVFVDVQEGIGRRDMSALNDRLTPQENARLQAQCDRLRCAQSPSSS